MNTDDRWRQVRDLFERALDQHPAALEGWLEREAGHDVRLRAEVLSLIEHHSKAGSFLMEPVGNHAANLMAEEPMLEMGQTVGPYTVVRELGRGGMGRVYLAADNRLGRSVALKAVAPEFTAQPSHRDRLQREARAAAALAHPGICTIYALEELDGDLFIAAEYVNGLTLRQQIDSGWRPTAADVTRDAQDLAAALAHAHQRGITHRDLKPENVMRTIDGRLKILDFGLARIDTPLPDSAQKHITAPGALIGTPGYMAPEQLTGEAVDARADVFAFGVLMYECACGTHPFAATTSLAVAARILEGSVTPLSERRPDLPSPLVGVIERCLRKSPVDRFSSAEAIGRALDGVEHGRARHHMAAWWRTHQIVVIAMYFIACALTWQVKEWRPGATTAIFLAAGIAATVAGVFRGHLVFTQRMNNAGLAVELRRAMSITLPLDVFLALALFVDGVILTNVRPLIGLLTIALGIGIALARLVVEPATTSASALR